MTATTKSYLPPADAEIDAGSPLTQDLMTEIRDTLINLHERIGGSYADDVQDHNHDGVNSALVEIGPNYQRNGSFESGTTGWTITNYTGGSSTTNTSQEMDGATCYAFTSTSTANGGGDATSSAFNPVSVNRNYHFRLMVKASTANVSSKAEVIWYDDTQAQISASTIYSTTSTETSATPKGNMLRAPATAKYAKIKLTGGVPGSGSATGTIYFDGVVWFVANPVVQTGTTIIAASPWESTTTNTGYEKVKEIVMGADGDVTITFELKTGGSAGFARVYKNGVAVGTERNNGSGTYVSYSEDFTGLVAGDLLQIYAKETGGATATVRLFYIKANAPINFVASL